MPKLSLGCSQQSAQRIVDLLFQESSGDALLQINECFRFSNITTRKFNPPTKADPTRQPKRRGGLTKITPDVVEFVHQPANRAMTIPQVQVAIQEKFGITMVSSTIYKIWKMNVNSANSSSPAKDSSPKAK